MIKKILIGLLVVLVLIQFIRVDKTNPPVDPQKDFVVMTNAPTDVVQILKTACYDCHSNETIYPWYFDVAPVSWWVKDHVNDGRKHLNFSICGDYKDKRKTKKLNECYLEVEDDEMPLSSYTITHGSAKLTVEQKATLVSWLQSIGAEKPEPKNQ